jgi:hypothetical protein
VAHVVTHSGVRKALLGNLEHDLDAVERRDDRLGHHARTGTSSELLPREARVRVEAEHFGRAGQRLAAPLAHPLIHNSAQTARGGDLTAHREMDALQSIIDARWSEVDREAQIGIYNATSFDFIEHDSLETGTDMHALSYNQVRCAPLLARLCAA